MRSRKLFCEINPLCYKISVEKEILLRNIKDFFSKEKIAKNIVQYELPNIVKSHSSILIRNLNGVDMQLQKNKVSNIELACSKINGILIHPGETFSYCKTVGRADKKHGYKDGLVIGKNGFRAGIGGGLCQMANMIHWLVLNSPLEVTELHHHSDALFPDDRRRVPFGTGTSVFYNNLDYRFKNNTDQDIQILVWVENGELCGELRSEKEFPYRYKLVEENHHFRKEGDKYYRISQVYRDIVSKKNNELIKKELILDNHSLVMYDYSLIPCEQIRNELTIYDRIKESVDCYRNNIFYNVNNTCLSYGEIWDSCIKYAEILKSNVDGPVIIYGHKEVNVVKSIISCLLAKKTYVPIGSCTPLKRLKKIVEITNSKLILTDYDISIDNVECVSIDKLKYNPLITSLNKNNDIAYIIFTSGSTGEPKGVPISYSNLNNFISWISKIKPLSDYKNINVLNQASFSFDLSVADFYYSLCNGHTLYAFEGDIQNNFNEIFDLMKKVDVSVMTPTLMKICLLDNNFNSFNYSNLKCLYFCGEMLENKLVKKIFDRFPNINIINAYGPTEATSAVSAINITKDMVEKNDLLPVGDMNNLATNVEIINEEIVLKGKSVFSGYLNNITGGYYKENEINCYCTGDLGYIKNNKLYCIGRKDNQVKFKGYRIELNDIEKNISLISGVLDCAVVAKYNDENVVKTIKAFVVGNNIDSNYIKDNLSKLIPEYMMPKSIKIIDKLPINKNGKVDRKALSNL